MSIEIYGLCDGCGRDVTRNLHSQISELQKRHGIVRG